MRLFWEGNVRPRENRNDRNNADSVAVSTADLGRVIIAVASAAVHTAGITRLAMQRSVAACARSVVVDDRSAATRVSPKHAIADVSSAAHLRRCSIGSSSTAGVEPAVDDN